MTSVTRPKGPLPARVYWTRRLLLLGVVLAVVFGTARLLPGDEGTRPSAAPAARPAAGSPQTSGASPSAGMTPEARPGTGSARRERGKNAKPKAKPTPTRTPLAQPEGTCADEDVAVDPVVQSPAIAGTDVTVRLEVTSRTTPACYWEVSPESVVLRISSGDDRIWTSQECRRAIPTEEVVVRQGDSRRTASVPVVWSTLRSDPGCTKSTQWARPGWYHATAAALSGEPIDRQFELVLPVRPTITPTPSPSAKNKKKSEQGTKKKQDR